MGKKSTKRQRTKHVPARTCVACRARRPKRELIRIVRTSDSTLVIDATGKRNGRGAYLCPQRDCWERALRQGSLEHALRYVLTDADLERLHTYMETLP
jgi:hypothetical protein